MKEWTSSMSIEETKAILFRAQELRELGRKEEAIALQKKVPMNTGSNIIFKIAPAAIIPIAVFIHPSARITMFAPCMKFTNTDPR